MSETENKENGEWSKEATEKLTSILVKMIDKRIEILGLQNHAIDLEGDEFSHVVMMIATEVFESNIGEADLDTHIENWFSYNATSYVDDMIYDWMSYNFSLSDYDDGNLDVESRVIDWIESGCVSLNQNHILTINEYKRIMEVVDLIRPETKQVVKEQTYAEFLNESIDTCSVGELEDLLIRKIADSSQLSSVITSLVDKYKDTDKESE